MDDRHTIATSGELDQVPFGWELVRQFTTLEGQVHSLLFDHQSLEKLWLIGASSFADLPERFHFQSMHAQQLEDDDGRTLPQGWTRHIVEDGLSCYGNANMATGLRQWWSPAGPQPSTRVKLKMVELTDVYMPSLRRDPSKMHAWIRVTVEWVHALRLEWFIDEDGKTTDDACLWTCCKLLTEAYEACQRVVTPQFATPYLATRFAEARTVLSRQEFNSPMSPMTEHAMVVCLDKGSEFCRIDELAKLLEIYHEAGMQHVVLNLQIRTVDPVRHTKGYLQAYFSIVALTNVLLLEPSVCCFLLEALMARKSDAGTLTLNSSSGVWLLRRIKCGLKDLIKTMRLLLVVQVHCSRQSTSKPDPSLDDLSKSGRSKAFEFAAFEDMCFLVFIDWLKTHWYLRGDEREQAAKGASTGSDLDSAQLWTSLWQSILDLKVGKVRLEKWFRENYSDFQAELRSDEVAPSPTSSLVGYTARPAASGATVSHSPLTRRAEFEALMREALEEASLYSEILELHNTERALRASNLSIEEAHSVGRITQLAYVFLPLTFVTGVFGMNITAFGGGAPMWQFWITTWLILLPAWGFGLWTVRTEIKESIERKGVIERLKTTSGHLKNSPGIAKSSLFAAIRRTLAQGYRKEKTAPALHDDGGGRDV